ncbi:MAG: MalM family protein [Thermodesulfobacteriota bacterium]
MAKEMIASSIRRASRKKAAIATPTLLIITLALILSNCSMPSSIKDRVSRIRGKEPAVEKPVEQESLSEAVDNDKKTSTCCESFREFQYDELIMPGSKKFVIDSGSGSFHFERGKSYYASFVLPYYKGPYQITIKSFIVGMNEKDGFIFSPALIFLDKDFQVTRRIDEELFKFHKGSASRAMDIGQRLEGKIGMTLENKDERYIIIMTYADSLDIKMEEDASESQDPEEEKEEAKDSPGLKEAEETVEKPVTKIEEEAKDPPDLKEKEDGFDIPVMKEKESDVDIPATEEVKSAGDAPAVKEGEGIKIEKGPETDPFSPTWEKLTIPHAPVGRLEIKLDKGGELKE